MRRPNVLLICVCTLFATLDSFNRKPQASAWCSCQSVLALACGLRLNDAADSLPDSSRPSEQTWQMGPVQVTRRVSHSNPHVSDVVTISFEIESPDGYDVQFSQWGDTPKDVQISGTTKPEPVASQPGRQVWRQQFTMEVLLAGEYRVPALEVAYRQPPEVAWIVDGTDYLTLEFTSLLENADTAEPKPNPGPLPWPRGLLPWVILFASLLAVAGLVGAGTFAWIRLVRRPRLLVPVSAFRKAMDAIARIEAAGWLERGEVDRFYTELSSVVRHYIEDRFGLRAPEQTTEEFLQELARRPILIDAQRLALSHFLEQCDLVKFAKVRPTAQEGKATLGAARAFVEAMRNDSVFAAG